MRVVNKNTPTNHKWDCPCFNVPDVCFPSYRIESNMARMKYARRSACRLHKSSATSRESQLPDGSALGQPSATWHVQLCPAKAYEGCASPSQRLLGRLDLYITYNVPTLPQRFAATTFNLAFLSLRLSISPILSRLTTCDAANANKMRLLDVHSVTEDRLPVFHELLDDGSSPPLRYAILSHTWGNSQEYKDIVFDDIPSSETFARYLDEASRLKNWQGLIQQKTAGFSKIANACRVARGMGLEYIWIDSCCIDKSKSAELNQSINSMYRWYKNSDWCIVHLEDLKSDGDMRQCRWFQRGWTLQELVAPSGRVTFYDRNWELFGERSDTRFCESLSNITGVDMDYLQGGAELASLSIAHKMSWAKGRETTVPEDLAYSLMGIFDVNMPLIYGEGGTKAFRRLQEEIGMVSSDLTIFAWDPCSQVHSGLDVLASRPDEFAAFKDMVSSYHSQHFMKTNKGIEMKTMLWRMLCEDGKERLMLAIGKQKNGKPDIGIILRKLSHNVYIRHGNLRPLLDEQITSSTRRSTFYLVSPHSSTGYEHALNTSRQLAVLVPLEGLGSFHTEIPVPEYAWDCEDRLFFNNRHCGGSDWRAIKLVSNAPVTENDDTFVVLISLKGKRPACYLLRWREELDFIFDRRHQTETTMLDDEFRHVVQGKSNEIDLEISEAKLSIQLIPTSADEPSGMQFRMEVWEVPQDRPGFPASANPKTDKSQSLNPHSTDDDQHEVTAGLSDHSPHPESVPSMSPRSGGGGGYSQRLGSFMSPYRGNDGRELVAWQGSGTFSRKSNRDLSMVLSDESMNRSCNRDVVWDSRPGRRSHWRFN